MRMIHQTPTFCVLELRGGTHLVLRVAEDPIPSRTKAPFDLMVDDVLATRRQYDEAGFKPSEIETGTVHRWFTVLGPDEYEITITSSHAGKTGSVGRVLKLGGRPLPGSPSHRARTIS